MQAENDILNLLREQGAEATRKGQRGLILQPGSIGDCILTIPLAKYMKDSLGLGGIDILGHTEYTSILSGRSCVDGIRSIDSMDLHRLFSEPKTFDLTDGDPLIIAFSDYSWIVTFLGEPNSNFEQNLIYTANCSHSVEVITLSMKPPESFSRHLTDYYVEQFAEQSCLSLEAQKVRSDEPLIKATKTDTSTGKDLLKGNNVDLRKILVIIQPGSGGENKCWHLDNFLAIAKELGSKDSEVIFLLGPAELDRFSNANINKINRVAKLLSDLSLTKVLGVLSCADHYIGNDTGITHLAAVLGIKTIAVFGPTNPAVYGPIGPAVTVFAKKTKSFAQKSSPKSQKELLGLLIK